MTFAESIRICLTKYADFQGRASRPEYWWFFLFVLLVQLAGSTISSSLGGLLALALLLPSLAAGARRLHDVGRSGWWLLLCLIPLVGALILLYWFVQPGTRGANAYGEMPAQAAAQRNASATQHRAE